MDRLSGVKVFSATKAADRERLGERITKWLREEKRLITDVVVRQSSDSAFHCLSIIYFFEA